MLHEVIVTWDDQAEVISWDIERVPRGFALAMARHIAQSRTDRGDARQSGAPERTPCTCGEATTEQADTLAIVVGGIVHRFDRRPCYAVPSARSGTSPPRSGGAYHASDGGYYGNATTYSGLRHGGPW